MENDKLNQLLQQLGAGTTVLTPLQLNDIRFSEKKTVLTPQILSRFRKPKTSPVPPKPSAT